MAVGGEVALSVHLMTWQICKPSFY